jgi:hypothetical protein
MKLLCLTFLVLSSLSAYAGSCKVYGISDGPQKLSCSFKVMDIKLSCRSGQYYLNNSLVSDAFHFEVEEGPTPLVFKAPDMQLVVVINSKRDIQGEVETSGNTFFGKCRF